MFFIDPDPEEQCDRFQCWTCLGEIKTEAECLEEGQWRYCNENEVKNMAKYVIISDIIRIIHCRAHTFSTGNNDNGLYKLSLGRFLLLFVCKVCLLIISIINYVHFDWRKWFKFLFAISQEDKSILPLHYNYITI